jgi:hypothetical protein
VDVFTFIARAVVWVFESLMGLMVIAMLGLFAWILVMLVTGAARH